MGIATNLCLLTLTVVFLVTEASPRYRYNDIIDAIELQRRLLAEVAAIERQGRPLAEVAAIERQGRPLAEVAEYKKDDIWQQPTAPVCK